MSDRGGKCMLVNPRPQVLKVLEIVKVPELGAVFSLLWLPERETRHLDLELQALI